MSSFDLKHGVFNAIVKYSTCSIFDSNYKLQNPACVLNLCGFIIHNVAVFAVPCRHTVL